MIKKDDFGGRPNAGSDRVKHAFCNFYMAVKNLKVSIGEALTIKTSNEKCEVNKYGN